MRRARGEHCGALKYFHLFNIPERNSAILRAYDRSHRARGGGPTDPPRSARSTMPTEIARKSLHSRTRLLAAGSAAAIVVGGSLALSRCCRWRIPGGRPCPACWLRRQRHRDIRYALPRISWQFHCPFSFADLVERVSPAVVTITSGNHASPMAMRMAMARRTPAGAVPRSLSTSSDCGTVTAGSWHKADQRRSSGFIIRQGRFHRLQQSLWPIK